jgi:DNA-binding transcriptional MerR regulator
MAVINDAITISEMARICGLSEYTLRYYEKIGLIAPVRRDPSAGSRRYSQDAADSIEILACLKASGLGIKEMRRYMELHASDRSETARKELFLKRQQDLAAEIELLKLKHEYAAIKVLYHTAREEGDMNRAERLMIKAKAITLRIRQHERSSL